MLSSRMLHFAKSQVFWDCAEVSACEAFPRGIPRQLDSMAAVDRQGRARLLRLILSHEDGQDVLLSGRFWQEAVRSYTSCTLTKHSDKLTAMWGVAKLVGDADRKRYGVGLWEGEGGGGGELVDQLRWRIIATVDDNRRRGQRGTRRENKMRKDGRGFMIPTWSWASVADGTVSWAGRGLTSLDETFYVAKDHLGHDLTLKLAMATALDSADEPEMATTILDIQGLFGACVLRRIPGSSEATMHFELADGKTRRPGADPTPGMINVRVILDTLHSLETSARRHHNFLLLAATCNVEEEYDERGFIFRAPGDERQPMVYSGFGLILARRSGAYSGVYQRVGLFQLEEVKADEWATLCRACGFDFDKDDQHSLGQAISIHAKKIQLW